MPDPRLSKLFERYRSHGDLAALGEVFDRAAPDLLRVARHLKSRGVEPEDLVQQTFLTAIERAALFDPERPLLPWLFGILVNQSRRSRRASVRTAGEAQEDALVARPDRENDAEAHEVEDAVNQALAELPENYREVLVPHLAEGKDPHVIARELGRPQGTVRAQIHRGIRLMRRMLPGGFALGGLAAPGLETLMATRETVLAEAARALAGSGDLARVDLARRAARTTQRRIATIGAAGILGFVAWFAWPVDRTPAAVTELARTIVPATEPSSPIEPIDAPPAGQREPVPEMRPPAAIAGEPLGSLVVEVLAADGAAPLEGALVSMIPWGTTKWFEDMREARTDVAGRASFAGIPAGRVGVHVDRGKQSRADVLPGKETVHRVVREEGLDLEAFVHEPGGHPIGGATIEVFARRDEPAIAESEPTDANGRVRLANVPREAFLAARAEGHASSALVWSSVLDARASRPVEYRFELARGGLVLEGLVTDTGGTPIAGARVVAVSALPADSATWRADGSPGFEPPPGATWTNALGRFTIPGLVARDVELRVSSPGRGVHIEVLGAAENHFGFTIVQMEPASSLIGSVRFPGDVPAAGAVIGVRLSDRFEFTTKSDAKGRYKLTNLPSGRLSASATAGGLGVPAETIITVEAGRANTWDPIVSPIETIEGRAIGQDGRVIQAWLVLAIPEDDAQAGEHALARWSRQSVPPPLDELAVQCWIGASRTFVVPCRKSGPHRLELRARNAWRDPPQAFLGGVRPGARDVELRVSPFRAHLRGRFVDARGEPAAMARIIAASSGATGEVPGTIDASTGRFDVELLPDEYALVAWTPRGSLHCFAPARVERPAAVDLGDLVVHEECQIVFESRERRPVDLVLQNAQGLRFELLPAGASTWTAGRLQPGTWTLRATWPGGASSERRFTLAPGVTHHVRDENE